MTRARRAEAFHELVEDGSTGGVARRPSTPTAPRGGRRAARRTRSGGRPGVRGRPAGAADRRGGVGAGGRRRRAGRRRRTAPAATRHAACAAPPAAGSRPWSAGSPSWASRPRVAVASQSALPGDGLYSVKRGIESAHAELTFNRADRGRVLLDSARTRLDEAQTLSRDQADPALVSRRPERLHRPGDRRLRPPGLRLPGHRRPVVDHHAAHVLRRQHGPARPAAVRGAVRSPVAALLAAAQAVDQVQQTSVQTCPVCDGPVLGSVPSVLAATTQATLDAWQVAVPKPRQATAHPGVRRRAGAAPPRGPAAPGQRHRPR